MSKVLVIGCGNVGSVGLHKMAQFPKTFSEIHVVSRTLEKLEKVRDSVLKKSKGNVELKLHVANVGEPNVMLELLREVEPALVVNWGAPYDNLVVMDACYEYGVNYIDTACYEDPEKYGFSYKKQLEKNTGWAKKGLLGILGSGFDPGVSNIYSAYARDYLFDKVETIDILDCNGGSKDKKIKFAPNFDPEINLRELILPIEYWKNGKWVKRGKLIDEDAAFFEFDFPEAGKFTPYLMYHEELETIPHHMPHLKQARFWMTFSPAYLTYLRVLYEVGMTRIDEVDYDGKKVVPVKFLKKILPKGEDFNAGYKGKTNIGNIISGKKGGKNKYVYIYNVCDHHKAFLETSGNAIGYTTAIPTVTTAKLVLEGKWGGTGVKNTEDKSFDSKVYIDEMAKVGLSTVVKNLKDLPKALKKNY
jgi:saccharopine dehydrogenase (NAD+, L-lysine-forming)